MARNKLSIYRGKRDFTRTGEPSGKMPVRPSEHRRYVIQKHDARRLHFDLRLELDGVFKSWAVTRGPSLSTKDKRLAVEVEDHPLDYGDFEGTIPRGQYGGGTVANAGVTLKTRKGLDWSARFPEIAAAAAQLPECIIDGEVVALDEDGAPNFAALQAALSDGDTKDLIFFVFDCMFNEGEDLQAGARSRSGTSSAGRGGGCEATGECKTSFSREGRVRTKGGERQRARRCDFESGQAVVA